MKGLWIALNVVNVAATGGASLLAWWRLREAVARELLPARPALARWRWRNTRYLAVQVALNGALCLLGATLIGVALSWEGAVPSFVLGGTAAFAAIWVGWAAFAVWDWWALGTVAELVERERRGIE
jgi:hypothetical protein